MKGLETGKEKIQRICDALRKETLEPAKQEAREIVENAHMQAAEVVAEAKKKAAALLKEAEGEREEKNRIFKTSLNLACRQGIEQLKQTIEKELFDPELAAVVAKEMSDPKVVANLLNSFARSVEEGEEISATIPKEISPRSISALLASSLLKRLEEKAITVGEIGGGVQIHLKKRKITIDISDKVVRELIAQYVRRDLRDLIFSV